MTATPTPDDGGMALLLDTAIAFIRANGFPNAANRFQRKAAAISTRSPADRKSVV